MVTLAIWLVPLWWIVGAHGAQDPDMNRARGDGPALERLVLGIEAHQYVGADTTFIVPDCQIVDDLGFQRGIAGRIDHR